MTDISESYSEVSGEFIYDDEPTPIGENPDLEADFADALYETLKDRNNELLEEISQLKKDCDSRVDIIMQNGRAKENRLNTAIIELEDKVMRLEQDLEDSRKRLKKHTDGAKNTKRNGTDIMAQLIADNEKLEEQRKKCAELAENSMVNFRFLKKKLLEAINTKNCCGELAELQDKFHRVSVRKEKLKKELSELQQEQHLTATALDIARHKVETLENQYYEATDHATNMEKERNDLMELLKGMRMKRSVSVENFRKSGSLREEMDWLSNGASPGEAGRNLEPKVAYACHCLQELLDNLKNGENVPSPQSDDGDAKCSPGMLSSLMREIHGLILPGQYGSPETPSSSRGRRASSVYDDY